MSIICVPAIQNSLISFCPFYQIKFYNNELVGGPTDKLKVDIKEFNSSVKEYYRQCGWNENTGIPKNETLSRLGLSWINNKLEISDKKEEN